jgi:hypothetical protein
MKYPTTPHLVPQGGWNYTDPDTGIKFSDNHINALLQRVRVSRIANGHQVGAEWIASVYDQLCNQMPHLPCSEVGVQERRWNGDDMAAFLSTLLEMRGHEQVPQEEYDRRVSICMRCPKRGVVTCSGCGVIGTMLQKLIAGVRITDTDAYPMSCMACGCSIVSKCSYPKEILAAVDVKLGRTPEYAEQCWMRE